MRLEYSQEAPVDLQRLRAFIAEHNPAAAGRIASHLIQGIEALKSHPILGHPVDRAPNPEMIRDLVLGYYIVWYLRLRDRVVILRLWHHREKER